jgi:hypothetical protein
MSVAHEKTWFADSGGTHHLTKLFSRRPMTRPELPDESVICGNGRESGCEEEGWRIR